VLMLFFLLIYKMESWKTPFRWLILILAVMASSIAVFVISPPDNLTSNSDPEQNLQTELFNEMLDDVPLEALNLREGKQVICFFSTSCEYCQMAAHKLSLMQQFYGFPKENITYLFMGSEEGVAEFYGQSESTQYRDLLYPDVSRMMKAINGNFPVIGFLEDGEVVHEYGFRNMNEVEIKAYMGGW
jgi:thiol-disulfide isomerase/thioredoxin